MRHSNTIGPSGNKLAFSSLRFSNLHFANFRLIARRAYCVGVSQNSLLVSATSTSSSSSPSAHTAAVWTFFTFRSQNPPTQELGAHQNGCDRTTFFGQIDRNSSENPPTQELGAHPNGSHLEHFLMKLSRSTCTALPLLVIFSTNPIFNVKNWLKIG